MTKSNSKWMLAVLVGVSSVAGIASQGLAAPVLNGVVINEVYGYAGQSGATYTSDFIELYNNSLTTPIDISGYQVNYAASSSPFSFTVGTSDANNTVVPANTILAPASFYLIGEKFNSAYGTLALPTPNLTGIISIPALVFKVQLLNSTGNRLDLLGAGTSASEYEGIAPASQARAGGSVSRVVNGVDTDQNSLDFQSVAATPTASPVPEPASLGVVAVGALATALHRRRRAAPRPS